MSGEWIAIAGSLLGVLGGLFVSIVGIGPHLFRKSYSPENAEELLEKGRPEEWNEVRILYPKWRPAIKGIKLSSVDLTEVNFQDALLDGMIFVNCTLNAANFDNCTIRSTEFSGSSLVDATFRNADLAGADFKDARIEGAVFENAKLAANADRSKFQISHNRPERGFKDELNNLPPRDFEQLVADILSRQGFNVELSAGPDRGYDIVLTRSDPVLGSERIFVEVKKYNPDRKVGIGAVRSLFGSVLNSGAHSGVLVTNSSFTADARQAAEKFGKMRLIDGSELRRMVAGS